MRSGVRGSKSLIQISHLRDSSLTPSWGTKTSQASKHRRQNPKTNGESNTSIARAPKEPRTWFLCGSIYSFPMVRDSCQLSNGVLWDLLHQNMYSWCKHGERSTPHAPIPLPSCCPSWLLGLCCKSSCLSWLLTNFFGKCPSELLERRLSGFSPQCVCWIKQNSQLFFFF